jgi:hypothetical protein
VLPKSGDISRALGFSAPEGPSVHSKAAAELAAYESQQKSAETVDPVQSVSVSAQEAQETARNSLDFLAALALPTVFATSFLLCSNRCGSG